VNGWNPPYPRWAAELPALTTASSARRRAQRCDADPARQRLRLRVGRARRPERRHPARRDEPARALAHRDGGAAARLGPVPSFSCVPATSSTPRRRATGSTGSSGRDRVGPVRLSRRSRRGARLGLPSRSRARRRCPGRARGARGFEEVLLPGHTITGRRLCAHVARPTSAGTPDSADAVVAAAARAAVLADGRGPDRDALSLVDAAPARRDAVRRAAAGLPRPTPGTSRPWRRAVEAVTRRGRPARGQPSRFSMKRLQGRSAYRRRVRVPRSRGCGRPSPPERAPARSRAAGRAGRCRGPRFGLFHEPPPEARTPGGVRHEEPLEFAVPQLVDERDATYRSARLHATRNCALGAASSSAVREKISSVDRRSRVRPGSPRSGRRLRARPARRRGSRWCRPRVMSTQHDVTFHAGPL
jgi:hypothetical protein